MVGVLGTATGRYGRRNLRCACDALVALGEAFGARVGDAPVLAVLLPPVMGRMATLGVHDRDLISLMEVLTMVGGRWARVRALAQSGSGEEHLG